MTHEKYIAAHPDETFHLVDKVFGRGDVLIWFSSGDQGRLFKQFFLCYVDNTAWVENEHHVIEQVENYLTESEPIFFPEEFATYKLEEEDQACCRNSNNHSCKEHENEFYEWYKGCFPQLCGGIDKWGVIYKSIWKVLFNHPKNGEQYTSRRTKEDILKWLSYMVYAHDITDIRLFENSEDDEFVNGDEVKDFKIPKY